MPYRYRSSFLDHHTEQNTIYRTGVNKTDAKSCDKTLGTMIFMSTEAI